ncbi:MAG: ATP-dependent helicase [Spirochaetaceae bacterium]|nr:ATP-dependent helicase [Spirochaetaceae bacterium]|tara:strand:+ start:104136 stop:106454 length:2319 start_codon:yes stop_codon:yes gene_type:complete
MNTEQLIEFIQNDPQFEGRILSIKKREGSPAQFADFPPALDKELVRGVQSLGIENLYTHQARAIEAALDGDNTVVVTPTASGKSLTYILPVLQRKRKNPLSRSLFLFPTKALSQDQMNSVQSLSDGLNAGMKIFTFDGDTPATVRTRVREAGDIVVTNPDMLHSGIMPHHTSWIKLFENLDFIVIDELHTYRGVFGSHLANVLRRLFRICAFYGSSPQILCASATIGNPRQLAEKLSGRPFTLIDESGSPTGDKYFAFYNPPLVQKELGVRASSLKEAARLGAALLSNGIRTIFFCRSRVRVELLSTYLRERCPQYRDQIKSYRGGYLPNERRQIEKDLREGNLLAVVSTNALELGIDIGSLEASVSLGYPGSIASLLQQSGRAGRKQQTALSFFIATSDGTDQFLVQHPEYLLERNPETAQINQDNLVILADHIKCAAFELPFKADENFGDFPATREILEHLVHSQVLHLNRDKYHWESDTYPASDVSLRSGPKENFVIIDISDTGGEKVIGEVDHFSAPLLIHKHAIYIHQGQQYYVEDLLWDDRQARVRKINVDYYTDAHEKVEVSILDDNEESSLPGVGVRSGEVLLRRKAVLFKKIKLETHENAGWGEIHLPELEMHTQAGWILFDQDLLDEVAESLVQGALPSGYSGAMLAAVAHSFGIITPVYILCDRSDIAFRSDVRSTVFEKPAVYFYDGFPGGMELSYVALDNLESIATGALEVIENCGCQAGCPSCTGVVDTEIPVKQATSLLLKKLLQRLVQRSAVANVE